ncbi:tRNA lysidine(34) synthetase TilS [Pedobacter heparinus]|uniref:tRNA lysidine(34) synthetase TilS n=1 Tax=Pedobacter heparinus TaxID=984 RepID=UPI002931C2DF|nr:tRNA lysidine(34) synthetase TilS [Pedobacter heparinus]
MILLQNLESFIRKHALFQAGDKILLAVSGGKDSVLMAHLFKLSGFNFGIAHCNFNLRAAESQRDESFVKMLAATMDVPFHVVHFQTKTYAASHKLSTQMAARNLRYEWFEEIRAAHNYQAIALAQHQNDALETVLLNLVRGTGIAGLHGILPKRGRLIRPLLFLTSADVTVLIDAFGLDYVEDSSNKSTDYARNKLRLDVIPHLKEINGNLESTFAGNIQRFAETELVLQNAVAGLKQKLLIEKEGKFYLSLKKIKALKPQRLLLFELLRPFNFTEYVVIELAASLEKQSGTSFYSSSHRVIVDRTALIISSIDISDQQLAQQTIHSRDTLVNLPGSQLLISGTTELQFEQNRNKAYVDTAQLQFPLVLRSRQPGDRFKPMGMKGFKKLSDFFIDEKIPLNDKDQVPVLVNGNGEVIWIAGLRQDHRYRITANTKNVTIFELKQVLITIPKQNKA